MSDAINIFTDGSCLGNPGPGGFGVILKYKDVYKELSGGFKNTTNNRMELLAVIKALEAIKLPCKINIHTDSQYVCKAITNGWLKNWKNNNWKNSQNKAVKNKDLWEKLDRQLITFTELTFVWVKGHDGHKENERCDVLAKQAASQNNLQEDIV